MSRKKISINESQFKRLFNEAAMDGSLTVD